MILVPSTVNFGLEHKYVSLIQEMVSFLEEPEPACVPGRPYLQLVGIRAD